MQIPPRPAKYPVNVFDNIQQEGISRRACHAATVIHLMARFLHIFTEYFADIAVRNAHAPELQSRGGRLDTVMNTDNRFFGIIIGGIVVVAIVIFIFSGGELGGKKTIEGDDDLPPISNTDK
jgi:hypothetical protein